MVKFPWKSCLFLNIFWKKYPWRRLRRRPQGAAAPWGGVFFQNVFENRPDFQRILTNAKSCFQTSHFSRFSKFHYFFEKSNKFHESTNTFFNSGKIGQWKKILSTDQLNNIENFCRNEMIELGYL